MNMSNHTWLVMCGWSTWKGLGWGAIIYLAAISGIDHELYEAARVDGAGRFKLIWHITIPGLIPTYVVLLLLNIAGFLNNGFDQYYVFQNAFNQSRIQVLDLYVYNLGMGSASYSLATVVGMLKSIVSVALLFSVNGISKLLRGETIV
jgi:multiple sugar transport system permease protein/putative aldouronate transport system permease protein